MHIDMRTNKIISCGFPKFMSIDHGKDRFHFTADEIVHIKDIRATEKIDGTCLLRYVFDGKVKWRTKQMFHVQLENQFEIEDFEKQFPLLADPNFCQNLTLIFEWVSPFNEIVVKYHTPSLTLIGGVSYDDRKWYEADIQLLTLEELEKISDLSDVPLVKYFQLRSSDEITQLMKSLETSEKSEGYVLRTSNDQTMIKVKTKWWVLLFSCKLNFSTTLAVELWLYWNKPSWSEYQSRFIDAFDQDAWNKAMPIVSAMYEGTKAATNAVNHVMKFYHDHAQQPDIDEIAKKRFSMLRLEMYNSIKAGKDVPEEIWKKLILQNSAQMDRQIIPDYE